MHNPETAPLLSKPPPYQPPPRHKQHDTELPAPTPNRSTRPKPSISRLEKLKKLDATLKAYTPVVLQLFQFMLGAIVTGTAMLVIVGAAVGVAGFVLHLLFLGAKMAFRS